MFNSFLLTLAVAMLPVLELRFAIPFGIAHDIGYTASYIASVVGNMLPVPFIILFSRRVFAFIRAHFAPFARVVDALERRARGKAELVRRYELLGLAVIVAIPLPGTGAWTGALVAALLDIRMRESLPAIFLGVLVAGIIVTAASMGVVHIAGL